MSRYIDADAVIARMAGQMSYEIEVETGNETDCVDLAEELLNDIPSIDIVRCKECKHNYNTAINHGKMNPRCDFTDWKTTSVAEEKERASDE